MCVVFYNFKKCKKHPLLPQPLISHWLLHITPCSNFRQNRVALYHFVNNGRSVSVPPMSFYGSMASEEEDILVCAKQPWENGWWGQGDKGSLIFLSSQGSLPPEPALQPEFLNPMFSALQTKIQGTENLLGTLENTAFLQVPGETCSRDIPLALGLSPSSSRTRKHQGLMTSQALPPQGTVLFVWIGGSLGFHLVCSAVCTHSVWSEVETGFWSWWLVCDPNDCPIRKEFGALALGATAWWALLWGSVSVSGWWECSFGFAFTCFCPDSCWYRIRSLKQTNKTTANLVGCPLRILTNQIPMCHSAYPSVKGK